MTKGIIQKVKKHFKDKSRKLLEKYEIVEVDSPVGTDSNGLSLEKLTDEGAELLTMFLWKEYRQKVVDLLTEVDKKENHRKKYHNSKCDDPECDEDDDDEDDDKKKE